MTSHDEEHGDRFTALEEHYSGYQVYDKHYEKIGKVDDLFVDEHDRLEYIGVKMGFLGTKSTLIPMDIVRVNDERKLIEVAADKATVKEGPSFDEDEEITPRFERTVHSYYGAERAEERAEREAYGAYYSETTGDGRVDLRPGERAEQRDRAGEEYPGPATGDVDHERGRLREPSVSPGHEDVEGTPHEREAGDIKVRRRERADDRWTSAPKRSE